VESDEPYYRRDLAHVFDQGYGFHAEACAPGLLALLEDVRARQGLVLEIGCGSGLLTKRLVEAGHRVIATDASPAMLDLARDAAGGAVDIRTLTLPDDPIPAVDAVVGIGHALNYLADAAAVRRGLVALADALSPGGLLAVDLCDFEWGTARQGAMAQGRVGESWAIITEFSQPAPDRFDRDLTTFVRGADGNYRRDDEHHRNILFDTSLVPALLRERGVTATVGNSFDDESHPLPVGLRSIIGHR
jgi:SAM-dependent methyltransferase